MTYFKDAPKKVQGIPNGFIMNKPFAPNCIPGDVGLELEIEGTGLPTTFSRISTSSGAQWAVKNDGSLRGGFEYVFTSPANIGDVEELVRYLYSRLGDSVLNLSNRCSTHVHLNVSNWKINKIVALYLLWTSLETPLIEWCGVERKSCHYALTAQEQNATLERVEDLLREGRWTFTDGLKYTSFNFLRLRDLGSVEIRCGNAYSTPEPVIAWTKFLNGLKDFTYERVPHPEGVASLISELGPTGLIKSLGEFSGTEAFVEEVLAKSPDFDYSVRESFREVQRLAYYFPWWEWEELFNRPYIPDPFGTAKKASIRDLEAAGTATLTTQPRVLNLRTTARALGAGTQWTTVNDTIDIATNPPTAPNPVQADFDEEIRRLSELIRQNQRN